MAAKLDTAQDSVTQGIPLDLGPLLSPYRHHKKLAIRIEKLPQLSRLSNGHNNGDCTYSLKLDELQGLLYLPPPGEEPSPVTLVLRVINVDDDYATTLALIDVSLPQEPSGDDGANPKLRVVEADKDDDAGTPDEPAEAASLMSIHVKRPPQTVGKVGSEPPDVRKELDAELSQLREQMAASSSDAEATHQQALQAAEAALARDFVEQIKATKEQLEQGFEARLAQALQQAEAQTEETVNARIADIEKKAEEAAAHARAEAQKDFEKELSELQQQRDAGAVDIDEVRQQALKTAEAEHARVVADLEATHQRALKEQISETKERLEAEFASRLEKAVNQAEKQTAALAAAAADKKVEHAEAEATRARAKAKKEFEKELSRLQKQLDAAGSDRNKEHKKEMAAAESAHALAIEELQKAHAAALETQAITAEEQIAAAQARLEQSANEEAEARLAKAKETWQAESDATLASAHDAWQAEEAERQAAMRTEFDAELAQLRQQLESPNVDIDAVRQEAAENAKAELARQITELEDNHARALEEQAETTKAEMEQDFAARLAEAVQQAEAKVEAGMAEARQSWEVKAEATLLAARKTWKAEEAERIAALKSETSASNDKLNEQELSDRIATATREAEEKAEQMVEARLATARQVWEADADSALSSARETWQAEEAGRIEAATKALEAELAQLRENPPAGDVDIEEVRKQAVADAETAHRAEIEALKSAHASALEDRAPTGDIPSEEDIEARIAEALREAEEKTEARLNKARLVWQTDADAKLAAAREAWEAEVTDRQTGGKRSRKESAQNAPTARERAYRQQREWKPRRSWVIAVLVLGLIGVPLLLPEARSLVAERSSQALTGLRGQINSLRTPPPVAVDPVIVPVAPEPVPAPPIATETNATVDVGSANIRSGPSSSAAVIKSLPRGSEVTIIESREGWQHIRFGAGIDDTGWVFGDLLSTPQSGERSQ
jgi:hypothetical protein